MNSIATPRTDALYGVFLQDVGSIKHKHPRAFKNKYYRFDYVHEMGNGYRLLIEPDDFPKKLKSEIMKAFHDRLEEKPAENKD